MLDEPLTIICADCGTMQVVPPLPAGAAATCHRCARLLGRRTRSGYALAFASAFATLLLLPPAFFLPLMDSTIKNLMFEESRLVSSVSAIYNEVWFPFAFGFLFFAFLFPAVRACLHILVFGSLRWGWVVTQRGRLFRWTEELRIWSMTDVVVIAGAIAYLRASIPARVEVRIGALCYVLVSILANIGDRTLDRRAVWNAILPDLTHVPERRTASCDICEMAVEFRRRGDACPRCGAILNRNIAQRFAPALGAIAAAIPLAWPAYSASIIVNDQISAVWEHTVIGTVQLLADYGYWQYGVVVLFAGVAIPAIVTIGMLWLLLRVRFPNTKGLLLRTRAYRLLHGLVRWPMILPFIAAIAAPIVNFRGLDDIIAGPGATPLFAVITLLIFSVRIFEPRLMWDAAGQTA